MATAFNFYQPQDVEAMKAKKQGLTNQAAATNAPWDALQREKYALTLQSSNRGSGWFGIPYGNEATNRRLQEVQSKQDVLRNANITATKAASEIDPDVAEATNRMYGMTAGVSDQMMNDPRVSAALDQIQAGMKSGPYSPEVQQQMVNRQADQTAAAEAANAEQIRADAAAMGTDPRAALRRGQAQRQQSNIAFQGDIGSKAAVANYGAQQDAARNLAATRLGQYGQAQQGYGQAANYAAQTQFSKGRKAFTY